MTQYPPAIALIQVDEPHVRVTLWHFPPGTATGHHTHALPYVVVPVIGGTLTMLDRDGTEHEARLVPGQTYSRPAGISHDVVNLSNGSVSFVEVEVRS